MFLIWDPQGAHAPYVPGTLRDRRLERVAPVPALDRDTGSSRSSVTSFSAERRAAYEDPPPREQRERAVTAEQLMSSPVTTLEADASLGAAWDLVETSRFRHVPIVAASSGALVGILSDRDLMRVVRSGDLTHRSVRELMATPVLSASNDTPIREVARILFEERIGAIPIVTEERHLRGILTRSDILRALVHEAPLDLWI